MYLYCYMADGRFCAMFEDLVPERDRPTSNLSGLDVSLVSTCFRQNRLSDFNGTDMARTVWVTLDCSQSAIC
jgi:hypothetical protein